MPRHRPTISFSSTPVVAKRKTSRKKKAVAGGANVVRVGEDMTLADRRDLDVITMQDITDYKTMIDSQLFKAEDIKASDNKIPFIELAINSFKVAENKEKLSQNYGTGPKGILKLANALRVKALQEKANDELSDLIKGNKLGTTYKKAVNLAALV